MSKLNLTYEIGQTLIVQLVCRDIVEGEYVGGSKNRIELINLIEYNTSKKIDSTSLTFYRNEISSISVLDSGTVTETLPKSESNEDVKIIKLPQCEYQRLKDMSQNFIYMATMDSRYVEAIDHIMGCETIGVVGFAPKLGRASKFHILAISTWDQIYLFDLLLYNKKTFPKELKIILQTTNIMKVVHDSRSLVDCLHHSYKESIVNLFDTQVADIKVSQNKKQRNLGECLTHYFNFPRHLIENSLSTNRAVWSERPLSVGRKLMAAQQATYLIVLKNYLEQLMLQKFFDQVDVYSKSTLQLNIMQAEFLLDSKDYNETFKCLSIPEHDSACSSSYSSS